MPIDSTFQKAISNHAVISGAIRNQGTSRSDCSPCCAKQWFRPPGQTCSCRCSKDCLSPNVTVFVQTNDGAGFYKAS